MKKIRIATLGYMDMFNPETETVEQKESIAYCIVDYSAEAEEEAKEKAYNGEYKIFDDEEPEAPPSDAERIAELEEALEMLLGGVVE